MTPDVQPGGMLNFTGMDWVGASTFGPYSAFNTSNQPEGELKPRPVPACTKCFQAATKYPP